MLFDEKELDTLDNVVKKDSVKSKKQRVLIKDMPHYIILSKTGVLRASRIEKVEESVCLLKVDNLSVADKVLNAIPNMKRRGLYLIPNWGSTSVNFGFNTINMAHCSRWFARMISELGYEESHKYKIINDPLVILDKMRKREKTSVKEMIENQEILFNEVDELLKKKKEENDENERNMFENKLKMHRY